MTIVEESAWNEFVLVVENFLETKSRPPLQLFIRFAENLGYFHEKQGEGHTCHGRAIQELLE